MRDHVDGLHDMTPEELNHWPRYLMDRRYRTYADGVLFFRCDAPNHMCGVNAHLEVVWEGRGPYYDYAAYMTHGIRRRVSPLYALTRAAINTGTIK